MKQKIVAVQVIGTDTENKNQEQINESTITSTSELRILASIRMGNGVPSPKDISDLYPENEIIPYSSEVIRWQNSKSVFNRYCQQVK